MHQVAIAELLRLLRPNGKNTLPTPASGSAAAAAATAGTPDCDASCPSDSDADHIDTSTLGLSIEKGWECDPDNAAATTASSRGKKSKARGVNKSGGSGVRVKNRERTNRQRFQDVESFWRSINSEQRRALLQVPVGGLLEGGLGYWLDDQWPVAAAVLMVTAVVVLDVGDGLWFQ